MSNKADRKLYRVPDEPWEAASARNNELVTIFAGNPVPPATILQKRTQQKLICFQPLSTDRQRENTYFAHPQPLSVQKTSQYITCQSILPGETQ